MQTKVLVTSASFQDVPGKHRDLLYSQDFTVDALNGPVSEAEFLNVIDQYDALLCGDDDVTAAVLEKGKAGKLKYISKYGVGVDKIDLAKAKQLGIPVTITPGVNQHAVAELVFALLLSWARNIPLEHEITKAGGWSKHVGQEIYGRTFGIMGFGGIGKEVAKRAKAFGLDVLVTSAHPDVAYISEHGYTLVSGLQELAERSQIISLHVPHTPRTNEIINSDLINNHLKPGAVIINTARGKLVNAGAIKKGLQDGIITAYLTDVLDIEPTPPGYILLNTPNVIITPHIGSRTWQSVERQGLLAVNNMINMLKGNVEEYWKNVVNK